MQENLEIFLVTTSSIQVNTSKKIYHVLTQIYHILCFHLVLKRTKKKNRLFVKFIGPLGCHIQSKKMPQSKKCIIHVQCTYLKILPISVFGYFYSNDRVLKSVSSRHGVVKDLIQSNDFIGDSVDFVFRHTFEISCMFLNLNIFLISILIVLIY